MARSYDVVRVEARAIGERRGREEIRFAEEPDRDAESGVVEWAEFQPHARWWSPGCRASFPTETEWWPARCEKKGLPG